jgi:hypothetical protein
MWAIIFLNSKSNRGGRSTHTTIIAYKSRKVNSKKPLTINILKGSQFSVREGKFISTLGLLSYLKKMRASRSTQEIYFLFFKSSSSSFCFSSILPIVL